MTDKSRNQERPEENGSGGGPDKASTGGHLGGTHFGQVPGDAKTGDGRPGEAKRDGDKARPNDGSN